MSQSITQKPSLFTPHATLAALLACQKARGIFQTVGQAVQIAQKTVKDRPEDKLIDILVTLLSGAHGLVEINTLLRADPALQQSIGRERCSEQSVAQQTLDAATEQNVEQLQGALTTLFQRHSRAFFHPYRSRFQVLDVDLTGMPSGKKAEKATKGYFAGQRNRRGRQQGRVLASQYGEVVVDQLFEGKDTLINALPSLIKAAERVLASTAFKRKHTVIRLDAGGGSIDALNSLLERGYRVVSKDFSTKRARLLAKSVKQWIDDPQVPGRQVGWVSEPTVEYAYPVRRLAVRFPRKKAGWDYAVLIFALEPFELLELMELPVLCDEGSTMLAYAHYYDQRGGGIESSFGQDKGGLGITKRGKKRFCAQEMLMLLGTLAHNLLIWSRRWLSQNSAPTQAFRLQQYGITRLVRDLYHISGVLHFDRRGRLHSIALNAASCLSQLLLAPLGQLLAPLHIAVILDKT